MTVANSASSIRGIQLALSALLLLMTPRRQVMLRLPVAAIFLLTATFLIYGFGAGYFWPVGLPTPLNAVATLLLGWLSLRWEWRYIGAPHRGPE